MQTQHWNLLWTSDIFCSWQVKYLQLSTWLTKANFCLTSLLLISFPGSSAGKESARNAGDLSSIPVLGRSPGGRHGNPLQYSCPENPHGQRSLVGTEQSLGSQRVGLDWNDVARAWHINPSVSWPQPNLLISYSSLWSFPSHQTESNCLPFPNLPSWFHLHITLFALSVILLLFCFSSVLCFL